MFCNSSRDNTHSDRRHVPLRIFKFSSQTGAGLPNAVFELTACNGCTLRGTTNAAGLLSFCLSPCATYTLREVTPPFGYSPSDHVYNIFADSCGYVLVDGVPTGRLDIPNNIITGSFTAIKINGVTGAPLAGALYSLFLGTVLIANTYSTETGAVSFENLLPGVYELSETSPPAGFQPNPTRLQVVVHPDGSVTILGEEANGYRLTNTPAMTLAFQKLDAGTNQPLAGAVFQLTSNGTVIATAASGADGTVNFGLLPPGTYVLTETSVLVGFVPNESSYQVVIGADGTITVNGIALGDFAVKNVGFPGFSFTKTSGVTGAPLAGAVFELSQNGTLFAASTSDMLGFVSFSRLPQGEYQLVETLPPPGYVNNPTIHLVSVSDGGVVLIDGLPYQNFAATNMQVGFSVYKVNPGGNPLAGAVYTLYSYGVAVQTQTSAVTGLAAFAGVAPGVYTLVETQAPAGYLLNPTENVVIITELGGVLINGEAASQLSVVNSPVIP